MSNSELNFLKKENAMFKEQINQLKQLLSINKEAMHIAIQFKQGQVNFPPLVELLYQQNMKLLNKINRMKVQVESGLCQALISDQIAFASTEHQQYITNQLKSKLIKMKKQLEARQKKIQDLQKNKGQANQNGIKIIQITQPNLMSLRFKDQICNLRDQIDRKKQQIVKIKDQKDQLMKLNIILTKQINDVKLLSSETTKSKAEEKSMTSPDYSRLLDYQKKFVSHENPSYPNSQQQDQQHDHESGSQHQSDQIPPQKQVINISKLKQGKSKISIIPKLELTKAKQIQQLIVRKINNDEKKKVGNTVKEQKYKKLQAEINQLRKKIGEVWMEKICEERQNLCLRKIVKELEERNQLIIQQRRVKEAEVLYHQRQQRGEQTLLDICRDVTMNQRLKEVLEGRLQLSYQKINCYEC